MTDTEKRYCPVCKSEIYPVPQCSCAGADDSVDDRSYSQRGDELLLAVKHPKLDPETYSMAVLAELLQKYLLIMDDNSAISQLSLRCIPNLLNDIQKKTVNCFVKGILRELENFKRMTGFTDKNCILRIEKDKQGNFISISVNIPKNNFYNGFLNHLNSTNRLPIGNDDTSHDNDKRFHPTPFGMKSKPKGIEE